MGTPARAQQHKTQDKAKQRGTHAAEKAPALTPLLSLRGREGLDLNDLCLVLLMNTPERDEGGWESAHFWHRQLFQFSVAIQLLFHKRVGVRELKVKRLSTFFFKLHHCCPLFYIAKTYSLL